MHQNPIARRTQRLMAVFAAIGYRATLIGFASALAVPSGGAAQTNAPAAKHKDAAPIVATNLPIRTWNGGNGEWADGASPRAPTYKTLASLCAALPGSGGMAEIPGTRLDSHFPSSALLDTISPRPVLRGNTGPTALMSVWGSGAFDGKSFLLGAVGGHYSYWGNEMYRVRVTDPPAAVRMYDPYPIDVAQRMQGFVVSDDPQTWKTWPMEVGTASPVKGPRAVHQYAAVAVADNGLLLLGGSGQTLTRKKPDGTFLSLPIIGVFDPKATTPDDAWTLLDVGPVVWQALQWPSPNHWAWGTFSTVRRPDGTFMFEASGPGYETTGVIVDPVARSVRLWTIRDGSPRPRPLYTADYQGWVGQAANGRYYYFSRNELTAAYGSPELPPSAIYEDSNGKKVFGPLPVWWQNSQDHDQQGGSALVGNRVVLWNATNHLAMVDLEAGTLVQIQFAGYEVRRPSPTHNGTYGRFAYVPQVGCFVGLSSEAQNAHVIRAPESWRIGK